MKTLFAFLLLSLPAFANSCVGAASAGTVNWHSSASWTSCGSTYPGNGDTAQLSAGTTMVCEVGQTCIVGTSPATGGTTALTSTAENIAANLIVNGTLKFRGPVIQCHGCVWTVNAGGSILHDSSLATSPSGTHYDWHFGLPSPSSLFTTPVFLTFSGNSGSHATFGIAPGSGYFPGFTVEGGFDAWPNATYTDFIGCGSVFTASNVQCMANVMSRSGDSWTMDHVTSDATSGAIYVATIFGDANVTLQNVNWQGHSQYQDCTGCDASIKLDSVADWTSGTRLVKNSAFSKIFKMFGNGATRNTHFTFQDMIAPGVSSDSLRDKGNTQRNVVYYEVIDGDNGTTCCSSIGNLKVNISQHSSIEAQGTVAQVIDGSVVESLLANSDGNDQFQVESVAGMSTGVTYEVKNALMLPSASTINGDGTIFNYSFSSDPAGGTAAIHHGTYTGAGNNLGCGATCGAFEGIGGENNHLQTGMFTAVKDNIMYRPAGLGAAYLTGYTTGGAHSDAANGTWVNTDYNAFSGVNAGYYYTGASSSNAYYSTPTPPGTHDKHTLDANFADPTRLIVFFDQKYLGRAIATAWASATAYTIGNVVSNIHSGWYYGRATNWTCIKNVAGSTANSEPGVGTDWALYWEPAAITEIRNALVAGITYADGAIPGCTVASPCSAAAVATGWLRRGYMPQNPVLRNAGDDGGVVGAVPMDPLIPSVTNP